MTEDRPSMPGYWKFIWMFWMQPVTLHDRLKACGIEEPDVPGWKLLGAAFRGGVAERVYLQRLGGVLAFAFPIAGVAFGSVRAIGIPMNLFALVVAVVVAWGIVGGVAWGVALSITVGVGLSFGLTPGGGIVLSVVLGGALGAARGVARGVAGSVGGGVAWGAAWAVIYSVANGISMFSSGGLFADGLTSPGRFSSDNLIMPSLGRLSADSLIIMVLCIALGVASGVAVFLIYVRAPVYFLEVLAESSLYLWQRTFATATLHVVPVLHHDLSYFPHPFLARHILLTADREPALARRVLNACANAPGQRRARRKALSQLQARELETKFHDHRFSDVVDLRGTWLPGFQAADPLLLGFAEAARYLASAVDTSIPFQRLRKLELAGHQIDTLRNRLLAADSPLARALRTGPMPVLEQITSDLHSTAEAAAADQLPNPFRAGEPLSLEQGRETFRGRQDLVRTIETLLGEPGRGASMVLLGPRRCGKTSLLKMLPFLLPDAVCVLFDLQDNPIGSPAAFFTALERRTREQARWDRQIDLPRLPAGDPFEAGSRWLETLDEQAGPLRILLCLDEFERMESLFPGSRQELLQVMGLLRGTIQHRRHIRLLVSGAAPFDELDAMWSDHLINVREVKIGHLDEETAVGLLRKPIPDFPEEGVPEEVAHAIAARTGGQPYLVQLYGSILVTQLNQEERRRADLADVPRVEKQVLEQATYYLRNTYQAAPPAAQAALLDLAHDGTPQLDAATRRWLRRRLLLTDEGRLSIPVLGAWIRAEEAE